MDRRPRTADRRWVGLIALSLLSMTAGCGGAGEAGQQENAAAPEARQAGFTDVTEAAGLAGWRHETGARGDKWFPEAMGSGGAFVDVDGDGWLDVVLAGGGTWNEGGAVPALRLYLSSGVEQAGTLPTFTEMTEEAGLGGVEDYGLGIAAADYDNDGDQDLYLTTLGRNHLFRNDGGAFTDVSDEAGVAGEPAWSSSAMFFDADRDGHLDLYVGNYVAWTPETDIWCSLDGEIKGYCTPQTYQGIPSRFYRNNGDGTFTDATEEAGFLPAYGKTLGVAMLDVNGDLWPDLAVANDTQPDLLYVNDGDGTFTEQGAASGIAYDENGKARAGMGIDAGVVDTTGDPSIFVGNFSREMIGVYRHLRGGVFLDRAASSKIGQPSLRTLTFGLFLFDVDLDGDLDLFAANGHVQPEIERTQDGITYRQPPHLFLNDGSGLFQDAANDLGGVLTQPLAARGAAYGDVDRDGDLDVLITENGGGAHLWLNELLPAQSGDVHTLRVHLEGRASNRDGLGARVVAVTGERRQEQRLRTGSSYLSQSELVASFGLGAQASADSLIVTWPSGQVDRFGDVAAGEVLVEEGGRIMTADDRQGVSS